ncbi:UNVERIFIED_CONTAM: hypothetical protein RMT77_000850 [Armadillidium vulgare]
MFSSFKLIKLSNIVTLYATIALAFGDYFNGQSSGRNDDEFGGNGLGVGGGFGGGFNDGGFGDEDLDPLAALEKAIPGGGVPGQDYPILAFVPDTGFACIGLGYYADTNRESGCQVFHICQEDGRLDSFLCPNGTLFNQKYFVCDWWYNVDCSSSAQFYGLNAEIGKVPEKSGYGSNGRSNEIGFGNTGSDNLGLGDFSNHGRQSIGAPSQAYGVPSAINEIASNGISRELSGNDRDTYSAPSSSYSVLPSGSSSLNGGGSTGGGQRNNNVNSFHNGNHAQAPSSLYQTPER